MSQNSKPKSTSSPERPAFFDSDAAGNETAPGATPADGFPTGGFPDGPPTPPVATSPVSPSPDDDPFNPDRLRLSQDFSSAVGVRKLVTTVPVRKPDKSWWVRSHPDPAYRLETVVLELSQDRETRALKVERWVW